MHSLQNSLDSMKRKLKKEKVVIVVTIYPLNKEKHQSSTWKLFKKTRIMVISAQSWSQSCKNIFG